MRHYIDQHTDEHGVVHTTHRPWTRQDYMDEMFIIEQRQTPRLIAEVLEGDEQAALRLSHIREEIALIREEMNTMGDG